MALEGLISDIAGIKTLIESSSSIGNQLASVLPYKLLPLIESNEQLKEAYESRLHYYERLKKSPEYRSLYERMMAAMENVYWEIDRSSLPIQKRTQYFLPKGQEIVGKYDEVTKETWKERQEYVDAPAFYDALIKKDRWYDLGKGAGDRFEKDSRLCPWRATLDQFRALGEFLKEAKHAGAMKESGVSFMEELKSLAAKLDEMLSIPWHRDSIPDFEEVYFYIEGRRRFGMLQPESGQDDEFTFKTAKESSMKVCEVLVSALKAKQRHKTSRKSRVKYLGGGKFQYKGSSIEMKSSAQYARVSQKVLEISRTLGKKVSIEDAMKALNRPYFKQGVTPQWKWLNGALDSANDWAESNGLPKLFKCKTDYIHILI